METTRTEQRRHTALAKILFLIGIVCLAAALFSSISLEQTATSQTLAQEPDIPILTFVTAYGYPMLIVAILLAYIGIPISLNAVLLAIGALALNDRLNIIILIILATLFATLGDVFNYYVGKKLRHFRTHKHVARFSPSQIHMREIDHFIQKWGKWSIFLTRWLITPLGIPVNVVAGVRKYPFKPFVTISVIGELLWACLYIFLGYLLGVNWPILWNAIGNAPTIAALLLIGVGSLFAATRIIQTHNHI